ncbi:RES family NAD+ phosphorylase [Flexibacterium corallicola]|uniref:RES family NAD+ phosphorylase n=1 Tax=Flexibacterium corallicola TaxID=3037259 RepID=UPI00286F2048|nr:RES family NAD+ phosphorylase [Pseudovibrio sp. M1P-2-3]
MCDEAQKFENKQICVGCVSEIFLRDHIEKAQLTGQCEYCESQDLVISMGNLSEFIGAAFTKHFLRTNNEPEPWETILINDKESTYVWHREGVPIIDAIMDEAQVPKEAAIDIQGILAAKHYISCMEEIGEEGEFSSDAYYEQIAPGDKEWQEEWRRFEKTIKTESRFFSQSATKQLRNLFDTLDEMRTYNGHPLIVDAGPCTKYTHLFRARVFQKEETLINSLKRPDLELGAPPSHLASSGRMNSRGIAVFYGATSVGTALAEVRPPVGSKTTAACFDITRPIKLLDLTALENIQETGSLFDPDYAYRIGRMTFLKKLCKRMTMPIMPDDQESEYLTTQAIADFLATEGKVALDGIIYPSAQVTSSGTNVVLFHKASRCKKLNIPKGTEIRVRTLHEGAGEDIQVIEELPSEFKMSDEIGNQLGTAGVRLRMSVNHDIDDRIETLSLNAETIEVHVVEAVRIETRPTPVVRTHNKNEENPFLKGLATFI